MERTLELSRLWHRVWVYRREIGALVLAATVATTIVAFVLPPWYRATGSLLPPAEEETGFGLAKLLKGGTVPGVKIPTESSPADVAIAVLDSRRINEEIVRRFDLRRRYKMKYMVDAIEELARHSRFRLTDAGTIALWVEDRNPKIAADILNAYVELLDRFNREVRTTKGRRARVFVEGRLVETRREMAQAEERLVQYQALHKAAVLTPEMSTAAQQAAELYAQRTVLQVRLGIVRSYSRGGSDEQEQIAEQLAQLDRQLASLPGTGLELTRLVRDVKIQEQLYALLTTQYEEARIDEARDVTSVDILDPGVPPEQKQWPRRGLMITMAFLLSLAVGTAYALFQPEEKRSLAASLPAAAARGHLDAGRE